MKKSDIGGVICRMLEEDGGRAAESSLRAYYYPGAFTGANFEKYARPKSDTFTAEDIVAVSMLSVDIPARVSNWILGDGSEALTSLLKNLGDDPIIETADLSVDGDAWNLWKLIFDKRGMGETKTSKLLAAKRPHLFPVYDKHVAEALGLSKRNYWAPWQEFIRSDEGSSCATIVQQMATTNSIFNVAVLRLFDVVVWMRQQGYRSITGKAVREGRMIDVTYDGPFV
jgi:hypothetical protein